MRPPHCDGTGIRATVGAGPGRSRPPLRTPGNRAPRRCPDAAAMTIGLARLGLVTQASARVIRRQRIARTEVIANASLRPISGFALRRRAQKSAGIGPVRRRPVTNSHRQQKHKRRRMRLPREPSTDGRPRLRRCLIARTPRLGPTFARLARYVTARRRKPISSISPSVGHRRAEPPSTKIRGIRRDETRRKQ